MRPQLAKTLSWPQVLSALRGCTAERVVLRDGRDTAPADEVRTRPTATGTEFCLFDGATATTRESLIERLESLAKTPGRRFQSAARVRVNDDFLPVDAVRDETVEDTVYAVVSARRPKLGFNASQGKAPQTTGRTKRIKTG